MPFRDENKRKAYYERHKKFYDAQFRKANREEWNNYQNEYKKLQRKIKRIKKLVDDLEIDTEGTTVYKATIIFFCLLFGLTENEIVKKNISKEDFDLVVSNWIKCGIYKEGVFLLESNLEQITLSEIVEITLIAMAGAGNIVRTFIEENKK